MKVSITSGFLVFKYIHKGNTNSSNAIKSRISRKQIISHGETISFDRQRGDDMFFLHSAEVQITWVKTISVFFFYLLFVFIHLSKI